MSTANPVAQCSARSAGVNRSSSSSSGASSCMCLDRLVIAAVRLPDPGVDVVAPLFPVAGVELVDDLDPLEPLEGLVAVHGGHVETNRSTVLAADRPSLHLVRREDVVA